jgi:hypothetical protein
MRNHKSGAKAIRTTNGWRGRESQKLFNAVYGNNRYLFLKSYETHKYTLLAKCSVTDC